MPKITLTFKIPEEREEFENANNGGRYLSVLDEFDEYLRRKLKYENLDEQSYKIYDEIRSKLWELRND